MTKERLEELKKLGAGVIVEIGGYCYQLYLDKHNTEIFDSGVIVNGIRCIGNKKLKAPIRLFIPFEDIYEIKPLIPDEDLTVVKVKLKGKRK